MAPRRVLGGAALALTVAWALMASPTFAAGAIPVAAPATASPPLRGAPDEEPPASSAKPEAKPETKPKATPPVIPPPRRFEPVAPATRTVTPPPAPSPTQTVAPAAAPSQASPVPMLMPPRSEPQAAPVAPPAPPRSLATPPASTSLPPPRPAATPPARPFWSLFSPQPTARPARPSASPAVPAEPVRFASTAGRARAQVAGLCVVARNGLGPAEEIGGRPAILAPCGANAAPLELVDGVLYVGEGRTHQLVALDAPASGCRMFDIKSDLRRTIIGACTTPAATTEAADEDFSTPGWARIAAQTREPGPAVVAGAPVLIARVTSERPARAGWAWSPSTGRLEAAPGLCLSAPSGDSSAGAPILLRQCVAAGVSAVRLDLVR